MNAMDALTKLPTITPTIITSVSESVSKSVSSSVISSIVSSVVSSTDRATITSVFTPLPTYTSATTIVSGGSTTVIPLPSIVPVAPVYQYAGQAGQRTLWVVFAIMLIATIAFTAMSWTIPVGRRLYHIITTLIVMFATMSYFAMATGHGISYHKGVDREQHSHRPDTIQTVYRQVYWARYVDWALTTPLLLLDLCLVAGLNGANITMAIVADEIMILTGLFAAFGNEGTPQKWGWYAMACIAYLVVVWHLAVHGRAMAMSKGGKLAGFFAAIGGFTLILWTAYPIVWGVADGSRKASVDAEIIAYAVLDVLAKPVFGIWLLLTHMNMQETNVDIGGFWAHGFNSEGSIRVGDDDEGA